MQTAWLGVIGLMGAMAGPVWAQTTVAGPAELPPAGYSAREYVDSKGCAFQRAGVSGTLLWVPHLGADRKAICGKTPSFAAKAAPEVIAETPETVPAAASASSKGMRTKKRARVFAMQPVTLVEVTAVDGARTLCPKSVGQVQRFLISDGRRVTKCGAMVADGVAFLNGLGAPGLKISGSDFSDAARQKARAAGQGGYRVVWTNSQVGPAASALPAQTPQTEMHWVQVGAFAQSANADRALSRLAKLGLPAARQSLFKRQPLTAVLAGPFATGDAVAQALVLLRKNGYPAAYARK